jgi:light-regulated signal transduction histidine kinase (bacteriophytochrome)/CheY-like chemotaxis protein
MDIEPTAFGHVDLTDCDREPILTPGSVQPHGLLLAIEPNSLRIVQAGGDAVGLLGITIDELIGQSLAFSLGESVLANMQSLLEHQQIFPKPLYVFDTELADRDLEAYAHLSSGLVIVELERRTRTKSLSTIGLLQAMIRGIEAADTSVDMAKAISHEVQRATGFDRVMVYKFLEDGSGHVVAETRKSEEIDSFLDLHYPASDIPAQARALYLTNWIRCIPDARYQPCPLFKAEGPFSDRPLDLSFSTLRSVSPVHLEYLSNMGVAASTSISLVIGGRLWGLVACHHSEPLFLSARLRSALELFAQLSSLQLRCCIDIERSAERDRLLDVKARVVPQMLLHGLTCLRQDLLALIPAGGSAIISGGMLETVGATPSSVEIRGLVKWLRATMSESVFATDRLTELFPPAQAYLARGAGLLAISISGDHRDYILWFLPEFSRTVTWAGNPTKAVTHGPRGDRLTPRKSFEAWKEEVRGRSRSWSLGEVEAVLDLRVSILELALRRSAAEDRAKALAQQNLLLLMAELDHRVKNTLATIQALIRFSSRSAYDLPGFTHSLELRIASMAKTHSLLTLSRWEGALLHRMIQEELAPYCTSQSQKLTLTGSHNILLDPKAAMAVAMALHELTTNSVKYGSLSTDAGVVSIAWDKVRRDDEDFLAITWKESCGPPVSPPVRSGFGRTLLERVFASDVQGRSILKFKREGLECVLEIPYRHVAQSTPTLVLSSESGLVPAPVNHEFPLQGLNVFFVEDNALVALDVADMLSESGARVCGPYGQVRDAKEPAEHANIDLALLDIDVDGIAVWPIAEILKRRHIPFMFLTGFTDTALRPEAFRNTRTIKKPYIPGALIQILVELAGRDGGALIG